MSERLIAKHLFPQRIIEQQCIKGEKLLVKESGRFRWFEYAGASIQSLMSLDSPNQIIMPVTQSFLLCLLINPKAVNILNLGLGGAALERCLANLTKLSLTSIEASQAIISMAKSHFLLPTQSQVICASAEQFVAECDQQYDVVLSDLFIGEQSADCIFEASFYQQLDQITTEQGLVLINLFADSEQKLTALLLTIKKYFPYLALVEFEDFSNIIVIASNVEITLQQQLKANKALLTELDWQGIDELIDHITYIPRY
ncbi:spermidine synthase [Psychromonas sp. KJ10-2]|uniref:spermidine synthase n=1 Tax=Psychromonas sp. KJ10-2 TaxID=3391822 RepID=UPI0039B4D2E0